MKIKEAGVMTTRRAILALVTGTLISSSTLACRIASSEGGSLRKQVLRARKSASAVLLARVVDARFQNAFASPFGESPAHHARLEVIEKWKGKHEPGTHLDVIAPTSAGTCSVVLTPGETYLLYLHDKEPYDVSVSRRNARLRDAAEDIEILRVR
jgi:hypothetical protein